MDRRQLEIILNAHKVWIESSGQKGVRADLQGLDLTGVDLRRANLQRADLKSACLQNANLQEANLQEADLSGADLTNADLRIAYLRLSSLRNANLSRANLRGADLWVADLSGANLQEANLREANLQESNLEGANLLCANLKFVKLTNSSYHQIPKNIRSIFRQHWHVIGLQESLDREQIMDFPLTQQQQIAAAFERFATVLNEHAGNQTGIIRMMFNGQKLELSIEPTDGEKETVAHSLSVVNKAENSCGGVRIRLSDDDFAEEETQALQREPNLARVPIEEKLRQLMRFHRDGLITDEDLNRKKDSLLDQL